jgi:hypothetical protein
MFSMAQVYGLTLKIMPNLPEVHEWVSIEDPEEERTWVFDVTFLESGWSCIFGQGCQGVLTEPAPELEHGCCSYGAHFTDKKDLRRVEKVAKTLTDEQWQFKSKAKDGIAKTNKNGETITRLVKGACIFLNRPDFAKGAGCALHLAAMERGVSYVTLKPEVCWQLPLRRDDTVADDGHVTSTITQWDRRHWGDGGQEFAWWCTESPEAFVGKSPVYESMAEEITEMVGEPVYRLLLAYFADRVVRVGTPLPHPVVRKRS